MEFWFVKFVPKYLNSSTLSSLYIATASCILISRHDNVLSLISIYINTAEICKLKYNIFRKHMHPLEYKFLTLLSTNRPIFTVLLIIDLRVEINSTRFLLLFQYNII